MPSSFATVSQQLTRQKHAYHKMIKEMDDIIFDYEEHHASFHDPLDTYSEAFENPRDYLATRLLDVVILYCNIFKYNQITDTIKNKKHAIEVIKTNPAAFFSYLDIIFNFYFHDFGIFQYYNDLNNERGFRSTTIGNFRRTARVMMTAKKIVKSIKRKTVKNVTKFFHQQIIEKYNQFKSMKLKQFFSYYSAKILKTDENIDFLKFISVIQFVPMRNLKPQEIQTTQSLPVNVNKDTESSHENAMILQSNSANNINERKPPKRQPPRKMVVAKEQDSSSDLSSSLEESPILNRKNNNPYTNRKKGVYSSSENPILLQSNNTTNPINITNKSRKRRPTQEMKFQKPKMVSV